MTESELALQKMREVAFAAMLGPAIATGLLFSTWAALYVSFWAYGFQKPSPPA